MRQFQPKSSGDKFLFTLLIGLPFVSLAAMHGYIATKGIKHTPVAISIATTSNPFEYISINAQSAYVYDIKNNKVLFSKNASATLPLASLAKIMTSIIALEQSASNTKVAISSNDLKEEGDSGLVVGEKWSIQKLIAFMLLTSSNDGARALASAVEAIHLQKKTFVDQMNEKAHALGMSSMYFQNPTGLDINTIEAGAYASAEDVGKLFIYTQKNHPEIFESTKNEKIAISSDLFVHTGNNTNTAVDTTPGLFASKTGFTDLAGGNLAVIIDVGIARPIVLVVLGSTSDARFEDIKTLAHTTFAYISLEK